MTGLKRKNLNFISADRKRRPDLAPYHMAVCLTAVIPAILVCLFLFDFYIHKAKIHTMNQELDSIHQTLRQEDILALREDYKNSQKQAAYLEDYLEELQKLISLMEEQNQLNRRILTQVEQETKDKVFLTGISYQRGILTLEAVVTDYKEAAAYVQRLEAIGIFERVTYLGFDSAADNYNLMKSSYHFIVNCKLGSSMDRSY